ncbi:MAG: DUF4407 domain-containing protein [Prevotellaceae bacterium]|jgi:hypothetical protein|nr:DUF4407 domain-containing protein [Prevotellaceae bacterium]
MKKIYYDYKNTGIKTIRGTGRFILVTGLIATLIAFINCFDSTGFGNDFMWSGLVYVLLIFAATFFSFGVCLLLAYLGENAFVARKQREALLAEKGIELAFFDSKDTDKITIKNKETGYIIDVTPAYFEYLKSQHGENMYEILEQK